MKFGTLFQVFHGQLPTESKVDVVHKEMASLLQSLRIEIDHQLCNLLVHYLLSTMQIDST